MARVGQQGARGLLMKARIFAELFESGAAFGGEGGIAERKLKCREVHAHLLVFRIEFRSFLKVLHRFAELPLCDGETRRSHAVWHRVALTFAHLRERLFGDERFTECGGGGGEIDQRPAVAGIEFRDALPPRDGLGRVFLLGDLREEDARRRARGIFQERLPREQRRIAKVSICGGGRGVLHEPAVLPAGECRAPDGGGESQREDDGKNQQPAPLP